MKRHLIPGLIALLVLSGCQSRKDTFVELGDISFHNDAQEAFLKDENIKVNWGDYGRGNEEKSVPKSYSISLPDTFDASGNHNAFVSFDRDFASYEKHLTTGNTYTIRNPLLSQDYYVRFSDSEDISKAETYHFRVKDSLLRSIDLDGVTNVRDFTGWPLANGRKLKQATLYRGATLNESYKNNVRLLITDKGLDTYVNQLGIKTEIDVRMTTEANKTNENGAMNNTVIPEVNYVSVPWNYRNKTDWLLECPEDIKADFEALADSNYPTYYHCSHGADRTGLIFFLLGAYLGMNETDLYRDYLLTNLSLAKNSRDPSTITRYLEDLNGLQGNTLSDKAKAYLLSIGVEETTLNRLQDTLTEM